MNYTLHQLQIFTEVVRHKSVTKAAEAMHMTQPALSIQLKNFQRQFEFPLVEILGKKLYITDFGMTIAEIAQNILQEADAIKYKTKEYSGLIAGKLRISSASTGKYVMPYFLTDFLSDHPGIDLTMDVSNKTKVIKSLADNAIDFALVSVLPTQLEVEEELLMQNQLFLVDHLVAHLQLVMVLQSPQSKHFALRELIQRTQQLLFKDLEKLVTGQQLLLKILVSRLLR